MYNVEKRKQFETVGELKKLLENISDETRICITGDDNCWFHIEEDESVVSLDTEDLEDCYEPKEKNNIKLVDELIQKSQKVSEVKQEVIAEIELYFDKYFNSGEFEKSLKGCIRADDIKNRKTGVHIRFWEYHEGCSTTHFQCHTETWTNPEHSDGCKSHRYKGIDLIDVSEEICLHIKARLLEKMNELGFRYIDLNNISNRFNYYNRIFYFGW